jgi:ATPase subunit of ABC transporter with duplicated ATPase domains
MLFTSQDHEILQTVANRIIVINGTKVFDKECTYNDYLGIE